MWTVFTVMENSILHCHCYQASLKQDLVDFLTLDESAGLLTVATIGKCPFDHHRQEQKLQQGLTKYSRGFMSMGRASAKC